MTGEVRAWTRATTFATTLADTFALTRWQLRLAALGLARRPDLLAGVAAVLAPESPDGKAKIDRLVEAAMERAGRTDRANIGTALHAFAEAIDTGQEINLIEPWDRDIRAYQVALAEAGIEISRNWIERIVMLPELGVAGTMDRLVRLGERLYVADLKTGADLSYSWGEIAIQLAIYAHAELVWDQLTRRHYRVPPGIDRECAIVIHLPAGEARCTIYEIDIASGWQAVQLCAAVREWRSRRDLARPLTPNSTT